MNKTLFNARRLAQSAFIALGLAALAGPAFGLAISNNAGAELSYSFKCPDKTFTGKAPAGQQTDVCTQGQSGCSGSCSYNLSAQGQSNCSGEVNALSGLQVDKGLTCQPF
jgi:hypothetical protein